MKAQPPSLGRVRHAFADGVREWSAREATDAQRRRLYVLILLVALGVVGPSFITLQFFPDPPTGISGESNGRACTYDAAPEHRPDRLREPTPIPVISGVTTTLPIAIRNSGTCSWSDATTLRREDNSPIGASQTITPAGIVTPTSVFRADIAFGAPPADNTVLNFLYRMRAPDGRGFGAPIEVVLITHAPGGQPQYVQQRNARDEILNLLWMALPGVLGFGLAIYHAGRFAWDFYSLKRVQYGIWFVLKRVFNIGLGVMARVKGGQIDWDWNERAQKQGDDDVLEKIGGPGMLSVHNGMQVVIERGARYSRIAGPGVTPLGAFERVRAFVDARLLNRPKDESAYTRDGIEVNCKTTITFRLMKQKDGEQLPQPQPRTSWRQELKLWLGTFSGWRGLESGWRRIKLWFGFKDRSPQPPAALPASPQAIRALVYDWPPELGWEKAVSTGIADEIPLRIFDELWAPDSDRQPRRDLIEKLWSDNRESLRKRGIELLDMTIGALQATDKSVDEQRRKYWEAYWASRSRVVEAEGLADGLRYRQTVRAEAQAELIQSIAQSFRMLAVSGATLPSREVALRMLEVIGRTMKAALEEWEDEEPADKAVRILERLQRIVKQ